LFGFDIVCCVAFVVGCLDAFVDLTICVGCCLSVFVNKVVANVSNVRVFVFSLFASIANVGCFKIEADVMIQ
jgi:hypothetical protein